MVEMFSFVLTYGIAWVSGSRSIGLIAWVLVILFTSIGFFVDFNLKNVYVSDCAKFLSFFVYGLCTIWIHMLNTSQKKKALGGGGTPP